MYMPLSLKILTQGIRGDGVFLNLVFFFFLTRIIMLSKIKFILFFFEKIDGKWEAPHTFNGACGTSR
jgi:hypothetical protein